MEPASPRLVVGLGNPGPRYTATRHNVGFFVADAMARKLGIDWEESTRFDGAIAKGPGGLILLKPLTFMNLGGRSVRAVSSFFRIQPEQILVVSDDLALPVGRLRIRAKGSDGGHNGLLSIIRELGTQSFPRLRVGIGNPDIPAEHYVLQAFSPEQQKEIEAAVNRAVEAIFAIRDKGLETAMNFYNYTRS